MTEQEILERCKKDYLKGTKFISPENHREYTVGDNHYWADYEPFESDYLASTQLGMGEFIYYKGEWATIINTNSYEIY